MHIASALTLVRREPVQSEVPMPRGRGLAAVAPDAPLRTPLPIGAAHLRWREALPGTIVLTVLAVLGLVFPILS
jgi:hypothetical protein